MKSEMCEGSRTCMKALCHKLVGWESKVLNLHTSCNQELVGTFGPPFKCSQASTLANWNPNTSGKHKY